MDPNCNPVVSNPPVYVNTRAELKSIMTEREKMEAELRGVEDELFKFEDSSLKIGGPYFGRIARGERAERIIDDIKSSKGDNSNSTDSNDNRGGGGGSSGSESSGEALRKVRESERLFSNSSVTSKVLLNSRKKHSNPNDEMNAKLIMRLNSFSKRP